MQNEGIKKMKLTWKSFDKAKDFIYFHSRPLDRAIFLYYFNGESGENVLVELAKFQNQDGGFGNALEPDVRMPDSSVIVTTVGLQILREMGVPQNYYVVKSAIKYLLDTYIDCKGWELVPSSVDKYPHAPWWNYGGEVATSLNPMAEITGFFFDYVDLVPKEMIDKLLSMTILEIDKKTNSMDMHELICCVRFIETKNLPEEVKPNLIQKLKVIIDSTVAKNPSDWDNYGLKPSMVINSPDSPFADMLAKELDVNLDYEIANQNKDGSWLPNWSWGGLFPEAWTQAEADWKSILTINNLKILHKFDRIEK